MQDLFLIFLLGTILNISAMVFNENKMPVYFPDQEVQVSEDYVTFSNFNEVDYPYLSDIFKIRNLRFSIGDVLMFGTFTSIIFLTILNIFRRKNGNIIINK